MGKSAKPTGLGITRSGNKFTCSWKAGEPNYDDGQSFEYSIGTGWLSKSVGKKERSKAFDIDLKKYNPTSAGKYLTQVAFHVKGNRAKYNKTKTKKVKGKKKTVTVTVNPSPSKWSDFTYKLYAPNAPQVTEKLDEQISTKVRFDWEVKDVTSSSQRFFRDVYWESKLFINSTITNGKDLDWSNAQKGTGGATGYFEKLEESEVLAQGSCTRWFRIHSRGIAGNSGWSYSKHVYSTPKQAKIRSTSYTDNGANGYLCHVSLFAEENAAFPIDKINVEYGIAEPVGDDMLPSEISWKEARIIDATGEEDAVSFPIDEAIGLDKCLYVRVNTQHDYDSNVTYGTPTLVTDGYGYLTPPEIKKIETDDTTYRVTVEAENKSAVDNSFLVVVYRPASDLTAENVIGIIPSGDTEAILQAPDWSGETSYAFGVYSAVGDPTNITRDLAIMKSKNIIWRGGEVPQAPQNVRVSATDVTGTVRVYWDWSWAGANGAEISWSDHKDAWESTDEPDTYEISKIHAARWNISGLETGTTWYVRVRLISGTGDNAAYGPYSEITEESTIDLTSAPSVPKLELSTPVITQDGEVTASWVYTTTDGTEQVYAEICEAEITQGGIVYGDPIAHTQTAQHITISANDPKINWQTGNTYNLCVRVVSASGRISDEWSAPVPITIAEPLSVEITETSLEEKLLEVNPKSKSGDSISFETEMEEDFTKMLLTLTPIQNATPWIGTDHDTTPYLHRAMPTQSNDYNRESGVIVGGTIAWNQLMDSNDWSTQTVGGVTFTNNGDGTYTINGTATGNTFVTESKPFVNGHVYFLFGCPKGGSRSTYFLDTGANIGGSDLGNGFIGRCTYNTGNYYVRMYVMDGATVNNLKVVPQLIDLTQVFGSVIADYVYELERATSGAGVAWFKKLFPNDYYEYNAGELFSVEGLESHDTVGVNQADMSAIEIGKAWNANANSARASLFIPVFPNTQYTLTVNGRNGFDNVFWGEVNAKGDTTNNRLYAPSSYPYTFTTTENTYVGIVQFNKTGVASSDFTKVTVQLEFGSQATEYEDYEKHSYQLDNSLTLRGIPKLDNGNLYYDGDTYASDGTVTRKYGIVDLGTLNYWKTTYSGVQMFYASISSVQHQANTITAICSKYEVSNDIWRVSSLRDKLLGINYAGNFLYIYDSSFVDSTAEEFKAAMSGVMLVYELATPTTETAQAYTNPQVVDPDGTEEYVTSNYVPVGHDSTYSLVCPISGYDEVSADVTGVNVWDEEWELGTYDINNGRKAVSDQHIRCKNPVSVVPNTEYHFNTNGYNINVCYMDENMGFISNFNSVADVTRTTPQNCHYILFNLAMAYGTTYNNDISINYPSTDHDYHSGTSNATYTADLGQTVYGGTVDFVSGEVVITHELQMVSGATIDAVSTASGLQFARGSYGNPSKGGTYYCDSYVAGGTANGHIAMLNSNYFRIYDSRFTDLATAKAILNERPFQYCYPLATPQTIQLTPQEIQTLVGTNNVWSEDGELAIRYAESFRNALCLTETPLILTIGGADDAEISVAIERTMNYHVNRPNEKSFDGYEGETVYLQSSISEREIKIYPSDLIGSLDDTAHYRIFVSAKDTLGQTANDEVNFEVSWNHQAAVPSGTVVYDEENLIARITPIKPFGAADTDVCDVYRLSADRPELILQGVQYGVEYVDPFPAIGEFGGYRIVMKTENGDYITEDNTMAWVDLDEDYLFTEYTIIDSDVGRILLNYNVDVSNQWEKDFTETKYLGGSVQGDWNAAVSRKATVSAVVITLTDDDTIEQVRRLADTASLCHIRTQDGSSFAGDIQVSNSRTHEKYGMIESLSFNITRVDPYELEGMTAEQWEELNEEEE